jgi:Fe2+ or Zn2+ uptake regulation protein/O6-methylguanine-DNA--protein-cysteine methyltransferase
MPRDLAAALRARGLRVTPQRRAILAAFNERGDEHLSADEVHSRAVAAVPEISRGTVYSTLAELTELGLLSAIGSPEPVRYETNTASHQHFRCRLCLRLFDVEIPSPDLRGLERAGFVADHVAVTAEGVCADCRAYERGLEDGTRAVLDREQLTVAAVDRLAAIRHATTLGPLLIAASPDGVVRIAFEELADFAPLADRARSRRGARTARERAEHLAGSVDAYLAGERAQAEDIVDWGLLPASSRVVLEATMRVPYGQPRSYDRVCTGMDAYECGYAMGSNPIPIIAPCHRVTRGSEMPRAYVGGQQRRLTLNGFERDELARC